MQKSIKKDKFKNYYGSLIFMFLLIAITFYLLFKDTSITSLIPVINTINPIYLFIAFSMMCLFIIFEAYVIYIILKNLNIKVPFKKCIGYSFIGFYFSAITPSSSGGQPAQVYYMKKDNINISYSSLTLLIVAIVYQSVMLLYGLLMYLFKYTFIINNVRGIKWLLIYGVMINVFIIGFIFAAIFSKNLVGKFIKFIVELLSKFKIIKNTEYTLSKIDVHLDEYTNGANYIKNNPLLIVKVLIVTVLQITAMYLVPYFIYKSFGLSTYGIIDVLSIQALLTIAVSSLPLPGAVGASESSFMILFKIFFSKELLLSAMLLSRVISFYAFLLLSSIITIIIHIKVNGRHKIQHSHLY